MKLIIKVRNKLLVLTTPLLRLVYGKWYDSNKPKADSTQQNVFYLVKVITGGKHSTLWTAMDFSTALEAYRHTLLKYLFYSKRDLNKGEVYQGTISTLNNGNFLEILHTLQLNNRK